MRAISQLQNQHFYQTVIRRFYNQHPAVNQSERFMQMSADISQQVNFALPGNTSPQNKIKDELTSVTTPRIRE